MSPLFNPVLFSAVALDALASVRSNPQAIAARQRTRLARLVEVAADSSPIYRERLPQDSLKNIPLENLPIIGKNELMARFDDWVTDPQLKLADLRAFVADPARVGASYLSKYLVWESSGTGHCPGVFVQDVSAMSVYDALEALRRSIPRPVERWMDPFLVAERVAFVGAIGGHFAIVVSMRRLTQINPMFAKTVRFFSILDPLEVLINQLNEFAPTVLATYPTVAALVADAAMRGDLHFRPKEVWSGGETLSTSARKHVESALDCTMLNNYGSSEFLSMGWECSQGHMHANTDWMILEPIDERGRPTPVGEASHSTLLTNLANCVQPLIRFDLGDQIIFHPEPCKCGVTLPVIKVKGRCDEPLVMAGLQGRPVTLLPLALTTVLEDDAGVFDFQLIQRDDRTLLLRLGLQNEIGGLADGVAERCRLVLLNFAHLQGLAPVSVVVETEQDIPRGRSGKAKRIVAMGR